MTQMVTRCPKCATAFRITSTQLESAKGAVRCGSCLHIFKAQEYLVRSATSEAVIDTPKASVTKTESPRVEPVKTESVKAEQLTFESITKTEQIVSTKAATTPFAASLHEHESPAAVIKSVVDKNKVLEDEDDVLISDDMDQVNEKAGYEFDGFIDMDMHPKQTVSLFEREIRYEPPRDEDEFQEDESWAEDLLDDDEETLHQLKKPESPLTSAAPVTESQTKLNETSSTTEVVSHSETAAPYSGPIFSLVSENSEDKREEPTFSEEFLSATRSSEAAPAETAEAYAFASALFSQEPIEEEEEDKPSAKRAIKSSSKMRAFDTSRTALLMNIMPAPLEFTAKRMRRWYQHRLWPTLAILMAALLFFQVAYFKFDYFSRVEPYRTAYLFVCPVFGCEVPSLIDTSQILATNLIVRNHPDVENALMVDAILINNAPFEQPFPDLILSFSKLDETPVATRSFTPKEYLAGELAGMQYIPERQPVHITLEISDPGPDAVNYTLATH
jgi:predicted Zn finger-like uncharacterized protein